MQNTSNIWSLATCKTFNFILNFAVSIYHHATHGIWQMDFAQLGRPDFAACKIRWKHITQCLNLASHFASSKTLIFNKGFACTNYIGIFTLFSLQYIMFCIEFYHMQNTSNIWSLAICKTFDFILNFAVSIYHHATLGIWQTDFVSCKMDVRFIVLQWDTYILSMAQGSMYDIISRPA